MIQKYHVVIRSIIIRVTNVEFERKKWMYASVLIYEAVNIPQLFASWPEKNLPDLMGSDISQVSCQVSCLI